MIKKSASFLMLEILVVISLLFILSCITIPSLSFINRFFLTEELDSLAATFRFLQKNSLATNQIQELILDIKKHSYSYKINENSTINYQLQNGVMFNFIPSAEGPPSNPTKKINFPITFPKYDLDNSKESNNKFVVRFFQDLTIAPGTIYLTDKNQNIMVALTVPISQVSLIRKYKYLNKKWVKI